MNSPKPGDTIGRYLIHSKLGEGGMGEVYRAHDQKLNRDVALKVLPAALSQDPDRLLRFEQEAQAAGALNHPNILAVHDVGTNNASPYIVSELLDGEELRDQLKDGALTQRKALDYAKQIAEGLAAAHARGITHRDLKPENLFITSDGRVKILDFGLAKLRPPRNVSVSSEVATQKQITDPGTVMGTVGYMSPEQVRGQEADSRSDIFSFGSILYEMLSGQRAFQRETLAETMTAILKEEPPELNEVSTTTNPHLDRIVRRCLEKKPERRFHSAHDLAFALDALSTPSGSVNQLSETSKSAVSSRQLLAREHLGWIVALVAIVAAALFSLVTYLRASTNPRTSVEMKQFTLAPPSEGPLVMQTAPAVMFSPDGSHLISTVLISGKTHLIDRQLSSAATRRIEGTQGAIDPFFSPDGKWIGFFAGGLLKKVLLSGGVAETLCKAENARGGTWASDGSIIFTPGSDAPLYRIPAEGGTVQAISTIDANAKERSHRWPNALPGGQAILFSIAYQTGNPLDDANVAVLDRSTGKHKVLIKGGVFARYVAPGFIVYSRRSTLVAVPFDSKRLEVTGPPVTVQENVEGLKNNGRVQFSISDSGDLAYVEGRADDPRGAAQPLVWVDRRGTEQVLSETRQRYSKPRLSADGHTLFVEVADPEAAIWSYNIDRGTLTRVTYGGVSYGPIPSPDGQRLAYEATRDGVAGVLVSQVDGSGEQRLSSTKRLHVPTSWTADGSALTVTAGAESGYLEVWLIPVSGEHTPQVLVQGPFNAGGGRFSPDGRWMAYVSDESGRNEVYLRSFPQAGPRIQISVEGGTSPVWSHNGRELFFRNGDQILSVSMTLGARDRGSSPTVKEGSVAGKPQALFSKYIADDGSGPAYNIIADYDVSPDGQRFVMPKYTVEARNPQNGIVILNWTEELKRKVVAGK